MSILPANAAIGPDNRQNLINKSERSVRIIRVAQAVKRFTVEIPSQPLASALKQLNQQTGAQFAYPSSFGNITSNGVTGDLTIEEALKALVKGTEVRLQKVGPNTTAIRLAQASTGTAADASFIELQGIVVVDAVLEGTLTDSYAAPDSFSATRTDTGNISTPQSSQSITRKALEDAGARTVSDSYEYLAGVVRNNNTGGLFGDSYIARGFFGDNILINGNRTGSPTNLDTANVERIEVLRGPTATLFGRADPGGLVNVITKQPLAKAHYHASITGGAGFFDDGERARELRGTIDVGGPLGTQSNVRYRLNMAADFRRTFRQNIDDKVFMVAPVVEVKLSDRTTANIELSYQHKKFAFDRGVSHHGGHGSHDFFGGRALD
ncbi:MAG: TonB-dependent receptor [Pseudomonadota bacterium]